ncbi:MAG TPA: universal stress protein [Candidatus Dormibacteraeota bacterium]
MIRCIVAATDDSPTARVAVGHAVDLARGLGARLHLVGASRRLPAWVVAEMGATAAAAEALAEAECELRESLDGAAAGLRGGGLRVSSHVACGEPAEVIVSLAREVGADLIVVGNRGVRRLIGSVPRQVSRRAPCSVLIVPTA